MSGFQRARAMRRLLALLLLCATVILEVATSSGTPATQPPSRPASGVRTAAASETSPGDQHANWADQVEARPLFSPDRRPLGNAGRAVPNLPRLTAIIIDGARRIAIFAGPPDGHPTIIETGTRIGMYQVQAITSTGVTVAGAQGTAVIRPSFDVAQAPAPLLIPPLRPPLLIPPTR